MMMMTMMMITVISATMVRSPMKITRPASFSAIGFRFD
jgi:hypothetical protein